MGLQESETCHLLKSIICKKSLALNDLPELAFVYNEIKAYLPSFLKLFHCLKQRRMLSEKHISDIVEYAGYEFPQLTDRIQFLTNSLIHLESQKRNLMDKIVL
jgi:hypothetical protein